MTTLARKLFSSFALILLMLCSSCEPNDPTYPSVGINETFDKTSSKQVEFHSNTDSHLYLTGTVKVDEGGVIITVTTPEGLVIYERTIYASKEQTIQSEFGILYGYWVLKYTSKGGSGTINIKLGN